MRFWLIFLTLPLLLANADTPVSFHGFVLGQTLDEARKVMIEPGAYGPKRLICTMDADRPKIPSQPSAEQRAGIVGCRIYNDVGGSPSVAGLDLGDGAEASVEFKFFNSRLFFIFAAADYQHERPIAAALNAKLGKPTLEKSEAASNAFGAQISKHITEWSVGTKTVRMTAPDLNLRRLTVTYTDQPIEASARAALDAGNQIKM